MLGSGAAARCHRWAFPIWGLDIVGVMRGSVLRTFYFRGHGDIGIELKQNNNCLWYTMVYGTQGISKLNDDLYIYYILKKSIFIFICKTNIYKKLIKMDIKHVFKDLNQKQNNLHFCFSREREEKSCTPASRR